LAENPPATSPTDLLNPYSVDAPAPANGDADPPPAHPSRVELPQVRPAVAQASYHRQSAITSNGVEATLAQPAWFVPEGDETHIDSGVQQASHTTPARGDGWGPQLEGPARNPSQRPP